MRSPAYAIALICALLATLVPVLAIQANLAGIVDWHKPLIGEPVLEPTPPSFVELSTGKRVITVTKSNVLACLDAKTGDLAWRYKLEDQDPVVSFHLNGESVLLLSGSSGTTARLFSVVTGAVIWERPLHADTTELRLTTPAHLGTDVGFTKPVLPGVPTSEDGSVVILSDGRRLTKLALSDGQVQWGLDAPGAGSTVLFKQLLVTGDSLHIMALTSGFSETTLTTLSFDVNTARPLGDFTQIPSSIANPSDAHLAATSVEGPARVLWLEHGRIRSAYLSAAGLLGNVKDLLPGKGAKFASILDVRTRQRGFILGKKGNGAVQIIDVRNGAKIVDEFESSHDSNDKSPSVYTARVSETGITFNRVYWSFSLGLAATQTYSVSDTDGLVATGFTFPFDTSSHGVILANAVSTPWGSTEWPTILLTTSSGAIQSVTAEMPMWTREESLANIVAVRFIDLGERQVEETRQILADENIVQRLTRHLIELKDLPAYIFRFVYRLSSASYKSTLITAPLNATNLHRDQFGFQKLLVAVTKSGKVFALDSSNGQTIWSRNLGITDYTGAELQVEDMWTVREFGEDVNPTLAILATRTRDGVTQTVGFHVDGFTGKVSGEVDAHTGLPLGKVIFEGRHEAAFLTAHENCGTGNRVLAVADSSKKVYIFPFCKTLFEKIGKEPGLFFTTTSPSVYGSTLEGFVTSAPSGKSFVSLPTWSIGITQGETLHSVTPISSGPISSYGRVAGDKSTLYKYLNPHLQVIVTLQHEQQRANVFVVDSVTGKKVYESHIDSVITAKGVKVVMSENWLVFTWTEKEGGRIGSVELYEDRSRDHTPSPDSSAFASNRHVVSEAKYFILPVEVKALGMTVSKFGITAKELVYINDRNQVASIPRRLLDPRRPRGAPTASDKEEMLVPYDPLIAPEIKRVVSHKYQVLGATTLTSSPALVESTALLFAHGLDLFLTRGVNPSGTFDMLTDSFNKAQLLLTLAVLSVGLAVAKPAVDRAALKAKWF